LNQELLEAYRNFDDAYERRRSPILFEEGHLADNCKTYFELTSEYDIDEEIHNQMVKSEYLICDVIKILSGSSGVAENEVETSGLGTKLAEKLDLRTFASSLFRSSDEESYTIERLSLEYIFPRATSVTLETEDWTFTLEVVAIARINNNATPDWILWVLDESKSANYRGFSTLILL